MLVYGPQEWPPSARPVRRDMMGLSGRLFLRAIHFCIGRNIN